MADAPSPSAFAKPLGQPPSMAAPLSAAAAAEAALQQEAPPAEEAKPTAVKLVSAIPECVLVCGKNGSGELGVPGGSKIKVPAVVAALAEHKVVDACANTAAFGGSGTCGFVTSEGAVFCCGKNTKLNVLGTGQAGEKVTEPTLSDCAGASGFALFSNGNVALSIVGTALRSRGSSAGSGQLGLGEGYVETPEWQQVCDGVLAVSTGFMYCAALTVSGGLLSWGQGGNGQLGQKEGTKGILTADDCPTPKPVVGLDHVRVVQVALTCNSGVALCAGHEVFSWGNGCHCGLDYFSRSTLGRSHLYLHCGEEKCGSNPPNPS